MSDMDQSFYWEDDVEEDFDEEHQNAIDRAVQQSIETGESFDHIMGRYLGGLDF